MTAKALTPFCVDEMESFHTTLTTSIGGNVCHAGCTSDDLKKKKFTCPRNICHTWLAGIKAQSATRQFSLENTTVRLWPVEPWQIAKCYMGPGQDATNSDPLQTDPGGKLQLIINCKRFHPPQSYLTPFIYINVNKVKEVITGFDTEVFICHIDLILVWFLAVHVLSNMSM